MSKVFSAMDQALVRADLSTQIKAAKTRKALHVLERRVTRHYNAGTISARHLSQLDCMIMHRVGLMEE